MTRIPGNISKYGISFFQDEVARAYGAKHGKRVFEFKNGTRVVTYSQPKTNKAYLYSSSEGDYVSISAHNLKKGNTKITTSAKSKNTDMNVFDSIISKISGFRFATINGCKGVGQNGKAGICKANDVTMHNSENFYVEPQGKKGIFWNNSERYPNKNVTLSKDVKDYTELTEKDSERAFYEILDFRKKNHKGLI